MLTLEAKEHVRIAGSGPARAHVEPKNPGSAVSGSVWSSFWTALLRALSSWEC